MTHDEKLHGTPYAIREYVGNCNLEGQQYLKNSSECNLAASILGLSDTEAKIMPPGYTRYNFFRVVSYYVVYFPSVYVFCASVIHTVATTNHSMEICTGTTTVIMKQTSVQDIVSATSRDIRLNTLDPFRTTAISFQN